MVCPSPGVGFGPPPKISGHRRAGDGWIPVPRDNPLVISPAGTMHLPLSDWAKVARAVLTRSNYLKPQSWETLLTPTSDHYALGMGVVQQGDRMIYTHDGSNTFNHAQIVLDPRASRAYLVVVNANAARACDELQGRVTAAIEAP